MQSSKAIISKDEREKVNMPYGTAHIIANKRPNSSYMASFIKNRVNIYTLMEYDPTRTITLRRRFVADVDKRFNELKKVIKKSIVDNDCFGLKEKDNVIKFPAQKTSAIQERAFEFKRSDQKVDAFMDWLNEQEEKGILEVTTGPRLDTAGFSQKSNEAWSNIYIRSSYQKGLAKAQSELKQMGISAVIKEAIPGLVVDPILSAFNQPFHADRAGLIYTRVFRELKGVTRAMDAQISRELALGIASGEGTEAIARRINDRVDKIGKTRARLIARTEVIQTHGEAKLNEFENAQQYLDETLYVQWWSALDSRVRDSHGPHVGRHGKVFTREEGRALLGDPNCRCTLKPYLESVHGPKRSARKKAIKEDGTGDVPTPKERKSKKYKEEQEAKERARREEAKAIRDKLKGK